MWNTVIQFLLIRVGFGIRLADALGDDLGVALSMASILAVLALHTRRVFEKIST